MKFWDASAVIPLCLAEPQTKLLQAIASDDEAMVVWWGSLVECHSAFARLQRDGHLGAPGEEQVRELLSLLADAWTEMSPSEDIRDTALRILRGHPLRAADSLHLASAIVWADKKPKGHHFVCCDNRLREAAKKEGFSVLPKAL